MSKLNRFLKINKIQRENTSFAVTKTLVDEDGKPLEWVIKPLTTKENDVIRDSCTVEVQVPGKPGIYRPKLDTSKYTAKLLAASVIEPDLYNKELQDSYGVMTPEDLIQEMVDDPGEYAEFTSFIEKFNSFDESLNDKVEEAKN